MEAAIHTLMAWNQAGLIVAGLFMLALGGLLLGYAVSRHFCCTRTRGRVVAIRATGIKEGGVEAPPMKFRGQRKGPYANEMYYALYEYTASDGTVVQSEDGSGSSWLRSKIPGTEVPLMVPPGDPQGIYRPGFCMPLFGLLFGLPGLLMIYVAFAHFETNIFTLLVGLAFIGWGGYKFSKHIKPRDEWNNRESFRKKREERRAKKRSQGRLLTAEEIAVRLAAQEKTARIYAPVMLLIGIIFFGIGIYTGEGMYAFMGDAASAKGVVTRMERESSGDGSSYYPHVAFIPRDADRIDFRDKLGTNPPVYKKGDQVEVLYDPDNPRHAMIDRGIWNWAIPGIFTGIGIALVIAGSKAYAAHRATKKAL
jgi:hypothetical protein